MRFRNLLVVTLLALPFGVIGQISVPGKPYSFYHSNSSSRQQVRETARYRLPVIDNSQEILNAEKYKAECPTCRGEYYGKGIDVKIDIKQQGNEIQVENGRIWKLTFESETALGMQFYFNRYKLPKRASLYIYNDGYSEILGAYTHANNHIDEKFAIEIIQGNKITIEYFESFDVEYSGELEIYKVIHVFKEDSQEDITGGRMGDGAACNIDINCPEGNPYRNERKAVCRISYYDPAPNLTGFCSGFLINNNQFIRKPYVLTANHCIKTDDPESLPSTPRSRHHEWIFEFDYEKSNCGPGGTEPITNSVQGATLVTRGTQSDYALMDLQVNNLESWVDVTYLGWDKRDNINFTSSLGIHHPKGDVKKISFDYNATNSVHAGFAGDVLYEDVNAFPRTHWKVNWDKGITEAGSSGSPLLNQGSRLAIGVLSAGSSSCSSGGPDYYGRLANAWNTYDPQYYYPLGHYLDPNNSTQILTSYVPNPESIEGSSEGGGGSSGSQLGSIPNWTGVLLNPTHLLGDFSDLVDKDQLCSGNYLWKVAHGRPEVSPQRYIQMLSENYQSDPKHSSALIRNFPFVQGKEYVLSLEVYDPHAGHPSTLYLEARLGTNILSHGCSDIWSTGFTGQQILQLNYDRFKGSNGESKWWTFAIKFIPAQNYNNLFIKHVMKRGEIAPNTYYTFASTLIDRIGIHEKGDFNNPQAVDSKTFNSSSAFTNKEMANFSITAIRGASSMPVVTNGRNVEFVSKNIHLKDGFSVARGATFHAVPNDVIDLSTPDNPIGPLDHNVISTLRSHEPTDTVSYQNDYSDLQNVYSYLEDDIGIPDAKDKEAYIRLTPNPTTTSVLVRCEAFGARYEIRLKDINGKVIVITETKSGEAEIDVSNYAKGIYIVEVRKKQKVYYERLVIF